MLSKNNPSGEAFKSRFSSFFSLGPFMDLTKQISYAEMNKLQDFFAEYGKRILYSTTELKSPYDPNSIRSAYESFLKFTDDHNNNGQFKQSAIILKYEYCQQISKLKPTDTSFVLRSQNYSPMVGCIWFDE